jgi:leucyl-tRNA synthetase
MFSYPSGDLHMGHAEAFSGGDAVARFATLRGYNVLHPIGWDAFGLPAENAAIKRGIHPKEWTYANIDQQARSFRRLGMSFDWTRRLNTCDPEYYGWTQWFFLRLFERGLAYRKNAPTNWCPKDQTVLANEQVINGACERCGTPVVRRDLTQWFFKITDYAQRLLDDMESLEWPERVITMQRNWIGRSEGVEFDLAFADGSDRALRVFTTRPDTGFGVTYAVVAPEHPLLDALTTEEQRAAVRELVERAARSSDIERSATLEAGGALDKRGAFTGSYVVNPFTSAEVPVYVADYVLATYGTGAIMAVPAEDERDWAFAEVHGLPIVRTVETPEGHEGPYAGEGAHINSGFLDGLETAAAKERAIEFLVERAGGVRTVNYRLRDWLISRQRFWGCPIPVVYCPNDGIVPVPYDQLPVLAPDDVTLESTGNWS